MNGTLGTPALLLKDPFRITFISRFYKLYRTHCRQQGIFTSIPQVFEQFWRDILNHAVSINVHIHLIYVGALCRLWLDLSSTPHKHWVGFISCKDYGHIIFRMLFKSILSNLVSFTDRIIQPVWFIVVGTHGFSELVWLAIMSYSLLVTDQ